MVRIVTCVFGLALALASADALRCYECADYDRGPCFNPTLNGSGTCTSPQLPRSLPPELQQVFSFSETEARSSAFSTGDVRCYHYQSRHVQTNRTEVHRGCLSATNADSFCSRLQSNGAIFYYNVTLCRTCNHDLCNSSTRPGLTFLASTALLATIFSFKHL